MSKIDELLKNEKIEWKKLGDICEFKRGQTITKKDIANGNIPVIAGGQKPAYYHNLSNRNGITIAVSGSGAYAGFISYWEQPIFLSDAFSIEPNESLNKRYLYHWLMSIQNKIFELKQGSGIPHVYGRDLGKFEIPIPSIETQEKIVKTLDKFTNYVTELQAELQARTKQYEYYRDILLSEEYLNKISTKMYGLECKDYELKLITLGEIGEIQMCKRILKEQTSSQGEVPFYKIGTFGKEADSFISQDLFREYREKYNYPKNGEILLSASGTIGKTVIFDGEDAYFQDSNIVWISHNERLVLNKYLYYFYQIVKWNPSTGGTINRLYNYNLKNIKITLPPIEIQNKVVEILDKFQSLLADTKGLLPQEIEQRQKQYEYYREKLLTFDENSVKRERERAYISNSYLNSLKEAGELVGASVFGIQRRCLGEIGSFFGGISGKSKNDFINGNSKFITYKNVFSNLSTNLEIKDTVNINNGEQQRTLQRGDIIFTGSSEIIEECGMSSVITEQVKENLYLNSFCFFLRLNDLGTLLPDFSKYLFRSKYVRKQIVKTASGVTRFNVSKVLMEKVEIIVPSIPVQEHIVSILDKFDTLVNDISKGLPKEIELRQKQYEYYREKLLSFEK